jgi:hypothetical protein
MDKEKIIVYSNGDEIVKTKQIEAAIEVIEKDYIKQDLCFGEYIDDIVISSSVSNTLKLLGRLYKKMDNDMLIKLDEEGMVHAYAVVEEEEIHEGV